MTGPSPILLVHGAFHGGWCWRDVAGRLRAAGASVEVVDLPGHGASPAPMSDLYGDAAVVRERLQAQPEPAVLCGHSYGGAVITEAVDEPERVRHLVYLAAVVPHAGRSVAEDVEATEPGGMGEALTQAMIHGDDGTARLDPDRAAEIFYHDCTPADRDWAVARLEAQRLPNFAQPLTHAAWQERPSSYLLCEQDRAVPPPLQEKLARRCTHTRRLSAGHFPLISQPERVAELLWALARG